MSGKLAEIQNRVATTRQLDTVIGAMRGIAAARASDAQGRLAGIRACAATVGHAIGAVLPPDHGGPAGEPMPVVDARGMAIVLCTEQGFVGGFNAQIVAAAIAGAADASREYLIVGSRGLPIAREHRLDVVWSAPAAAHAGDVDTLANALAGALYDRLARRPGAPVHVIHAVPDAARHVAFVERRLLPFDFSRFVSSRDGIAPLLQLPVRQLLAGLAETYVYTELCEALMLSFAAENAARVQAMLAARSNVQERLERFVGEYRQLRQEEITSEIVELTAGVATQT